MVVKDCSSIGGEMGFVLGGYQGLIGPNVVLEQVLVRRSKTSGFVFSGGFRGIMAHCVALQCADHGIVMVRDTCQGTNFQVSSCNFERNGMSGVAVRRGDRVREQKPKIKMTLQNVRSSGNGQAGFQCHSTRVVLELKKCQSVRNRVPYERSEGAVLRFEGCTPSGF